MRIEITRRSFLACGAAALAEPFPTSPTVAEDWAIPFAHAVDFIRWMQVKRGGQAHFLEQRWKRYLALRANGDLWNAQNAFAFLMTPREEFVLPHDKGRAYDASYLPIGFGATISGPHMVARMTSALDVLPGEKVLEIGSGSGYQAAYLSNLTDRIWTVEIVPQLVERLHRKYELLIKRGYREYGVIGIKCADGYNGWEESAPFDKIIVTCGLDHIPEPLLQQLGPNGAIVIPIGPGKSHQVIKLQKSSGVNGAPTQRRFDVFGGHITPFLPFKKLDQGSIVDRSSNSRP